MQNCVDPECGNWLSVMGFGCVRRAAFAKSGSGYAAGTTDYYTGW